MSTPAKVLEPGIVHMPGRRYPAVAMQGDTMSVWLEHVEEARAAFARGNLEEMQIELRMLEEKMRSASDAYEVALKKHGFDLPYMRYGRDTNA
jgi:hypothetical protein